MIFLFTTDNQLFCLFAENDIREMREGRTKFVNAQQLKGQQFRGVIFGLSASDQASIELIKLAGHDITKLPSPVAQPGEATCEDCQGIMPVPQLLDGKCIVCWKGRATKGVN